MEVCLCSNRKASPAICLQRFCRAAQNCQCQQKIWRTCAHCNIRIPRQTLCLCFSPAPSLQQGPGWCLNMCDVLRKHGVYTPPHPVKTSGRTAAGATARATVTAHQATQCPEHRVPALWFLSFGRPVSRHPCAATPHAPRHRRGRLHHTRHGVECGTEISPREVRAVARPSKPLQAHATAAVRGRPCLDNVARSARQCEHTRDAVWPRQVAKTQLQDTSPQPFFC